METALEKAQLVKDKSKLAIVSLLLGLAIIPVIVVPLGWLAYDIKNDIRSGYSVMAFFIGIFVLSGLFGVAGTITGIISLVRIKRKGQKGLWMGISGTVLSFLGFLPWIYLCVMSILMVLYIQQEGAFPLGF